MQDIEEKIAHLTRAVEDLSDVVARQDAEMEVLTRRVQLLMEREALREAESSNTEYSADQRPPHW